MELPDLAATPADALDTLGGWPLTDTERASLTEALRLPQTDAPRGLALLQRMEEDPPRQVNDLSALSGLLGQRLRISPSQLEKYYTCRYGYFLHSILLLDNVQDPGNVGTILRTAHSFGIDCIYMSKGCADIYNPKTIQSSQGALFYIPVIQTDLVEEIKKLQERNIEVYATALHDNHKDLQNIKPSEKYAILVGNEGQGVRKELIDLSNHIVKIEMETFESLNVAIATSICMYTFKYAKR